VHHVLSSSATATKVSSREPIPHLTGEALDGIGRGDPQTPAAA